MIAGPIAMISTHSYVSDVMGQMVIRNIDDAVLDALRRRAAASGISMEEEARRALAVAVGLEREAAVRRLAGVRRHRPARGYQQP